jgi:hypothetical protein
MRRIIIPVSITLLTFVIGVTAYFLLLTPTRHPEKDDPTPVTFCELERDPAPYNGRVVSLKVVVSSHPDSGGVYTYDWSCGGQHSYNYPVIDVRGFEDLNPELETLLKGVRRIYPKGEKLETEIEIVGIFDADYVDPMGYAYAHHIRLIPVSIKQLKPFSRERRSPTSR